MARRYGMCRPLPGSGATWRSWPWLGRTLTRRPIPAMPKTATSSSKSKKAPQRGQRAFRIREPRSLHRPFPQGDERVDTKGGVMRDAYPTVYPPSITSSAPVIQPDSSLARKRQPLAMSMGWPNWRNSRLPLRLRWKALFKIASVCCLRCRISGSG